MKLDLKGRLLFLWVCFMQLYSTESFTWTVQPANVTFVTKGEDKSLTWKFTLTADEQTKSQTFYLIQWKKFNQTSSDDDVIASTTFLNLVGTLSYSEPRAPHIEIVRNSQATLLIKNVRTEDEGTYKIEYSVQFGGTPIGDHQVNVTVLEPSEIVNVSKNQDVCEGSMVALSCNATGKPAPNITWTRKWENGTDSGELPSVDGYHPIYDIGRSSNGTYCCTAFNGVGDPVNQTVEVIVRYSPSVDGVVGSPNTATEGRQYNLTCNVSWDPPQNVSWIKVSNDKLTVGSLLQFNNISRNDAGDYKCVASNRCGNDSKTEAINVLYKPERSGPTEVTAFENEPFYLECPMTGNPLPAYNWVSDDGRTKTGKTWLFERMESRDSGSYTCLATNDVGNGTVVVSVQVVSVEKTHHMQASIDKNENDASKRNSTCKTFAKVACSVLPNCVDNEVVDCGPGSIVVEFLLKFSTDVTVNQVISNLTKAVDQGKFGSLPVDTSSLKSLSPSSSTTATEPTSTMVTTRKVPECEEAIFKKKNCETKWVNVSVIIVVSVVVVVVVVFITCCLHKKRKCRKHTKVKNSDGQPLSSNHSTLSDSNPFAKDNCGYHKSGPQPTVEIENEQSVEAMGGEPIPAYAMVDKSKKKDKKKNKEAAEQKLTEDQYAVVDKSKKKKKKKNEQDNTYAEVDMSRTSKKKQKPGEVFYADLDEFQQMQKMPKVSTSPEPLPPIKRPEAYGETQYADITQFLKGNPDTGAVLPKDSITVAVSNTGTGSKEESSAGNTGDSSEATNETGF